MPGANIRRALARINNIFLRSAILPCTKPRLADSEIRLAYARKSVRLFIERYTGNIILKDVASKIIENY